MSDFTTQDLEFYKFGNRDTTSPFVRVADATISQRTQLAQSRPSDSNAVSVFSVSSGDVYIIATIVICNTTANDETYRIFHDLNGTTYDETTALFYDATIRSYSSQFVEIFLAMDNSSGNLAVRSSTGSALTFTLYGAKYKAL